MKLVKSIKRAWKEDKYKYLRRNYQAGNNLLLTGEQNIRREIEVLKSCKHPNIVQLLEVIDVPDHPKVHLGESLSSWIHVITTHSHQSFAPIKLDIRYYAPVLRCHHGGNCQRRISRRCLHGE